MKFRKLFASLVAIAIMAMIILIGQHKKATRQQVNISTLISGGAFATGGEDNPNARMEWELMRLKDPATGMIPPNMRKRELAYARTLPTDAGFMKTPANTWTAMGPYNAGGRTRAVAIDVTNENVILAGSVSGGLWRSTDSGINWTKVTAPDQHHSVTSIVQDTRIGQNNVWYSGSGEAFGNSADYIGNGMYKSIDGGLTWDTLSSTVSGTPQTTDAWDEIWNIALDPSENVEDVVYAATYGKIQRSADGGKTWTAVLGASGVQSWFTDVAVTSSGVVYATLSSFTKSFTNTAAFQGIWRSDDGITWTKINAGTGWPSTYWRTVIGIDPSDENNVYFLTHICNSYACGTCSSSNCGQESDVFFGEKEWNGLWKYTYLTGDGSGANGIWQDLSANIPANISPFDNFNAQQSYNLMVAVKPDDPNTVFIGGTNLYRSTSGFTDTLNTTQIGGYMPGTTLPYYEIYPDHHPDQHKVVFLPSNPGVMVSATDGGVFKTVNCMDSSVSWTSLNNRYLTTQLYTIAIDHGANNSYVVTGGMQDNGTWWTNSPNPATPWTMPSGGDGSFAAIEDGGANYYFSRQSGKMMKATLDNNGIVTAYTRIDPMITVGDSTGKYLFINPFILDPVDNNVLYLAEGTNLWRNDSLSQIPLNNEWDTISTGWSKLSNILPLSNTDITALACSKNPPHRLYYGISNQRIFRMDSANIGNPASIEITNNIKFGGYTSCISVDPRDADKVLVVYSNYNVFSLYYTEDGGSDWKRVAGNLETGPPDGTPPILQNDFKRIGDGPSCRWASIIPNGNSTTYLVGTSVGLFATDTLIEDSMGYDSTVWVLQGSNTIGNVVVDMIDYRELDGFIALGTHGNGVYTNITDITGIREKISSDKISTAVSIYPNPFSKRVNIDYVVESENYVVCKIFDTQGKEITRLVNETQPAGKYSIRWDINGAVLGNGIYFYKLEIGKTFMTGKMVKVR